MNNPLMYNDPSGEIIPFIPLLIAVGKAALIGAGVGAGMYLVQAYITNSFSFKDFGKSILMGAISGAVGGGVSTLFKAGSFIGSAISGMAGGFTQGILNTFINGADANGIWRGALTGFLGGGASIVGGGTFVSNVLYGSGTGALVGGVGSILSGGNFWQGAVYGVITGAAFAVVTSSAEMIKNYKDGYGFRTNTGVINNLVKQANINGQIDPNIAQTAISFIQKRYSLELKDDASMTYDGSIDAWGLTNLNTGNIRIGNKAFRSANELKATIAHEYYHSVYDRVYDFGKGGMRWISDRNMKWNHYDGSIGYRGEIELSGKMHIGTNYLKKYDQGNPLNPVWYSKEIKGKIWYTIPKRF